MDREIKKYMKLMKSGQVSEKEVSKILNIPIDKVRTAFIKYNKKVRKNRKLGKIIKEIIYTLDIDFIIRIFKD